MFINNVMILEGIVVCINNVMILEGIVVCGGGAFHIKQNIRKRLQNQLFSWKLGRRGRRGV
jgi:hypothetical protein